MINWVFKYLNDFYDEFGKASVNIFASLLFVCINCAFNVVFFMIYYFDGIYEMAIYYGVSIMWYLLVLDKFFMKKKFVISQYSLVINLCFYVVYSTYILGYNKGSFVLLIPLIFALHTMSPLAKKHFYWSLLMVFSTYFIVLYIRYNVYSKYAFSLYYVEVINILYAILGTAFTIYIKYITEIYYTKHYFERIENLERKKNTDFLTNLWNRRYMEELFRKELSFDNSFVVLADIDFFKKVNDTYGHIVGDYVLKEIAEILKSNISHCDSVARWGGEEFLIYIKNGSQHDVLRKLNDMREEIENRLFVYEDYGFYITMTFGVRNIEEQLNIIQNIEDADSALYFGKSNGRNQVVLFEESMSKDDN